METLNENLGNYLQSVSISMTAGSVKAYRSRLKFMVHVLGGDVELKSVTRKMLEQVIINYRMGRKPATVCLMVAAVRGFWGWCEEEGLVTSNPAARLRSPPRVRSLPRGLNHALIQKITNVCMDALNSNNITDVRNAAFILLLRYTGVRRAEAVGLDWKDIDIPGRLITVMGKGSKERTVPLHDHVVIALTRLSALEGRRGAVFCREETSQRLSLTAINQVVFDEWLSPQIGESVSPHQLRHTVATELVELGAGIDEVAMLLGHVSVRTTQIYVAVSTDRLRSAINRL